VLIPHIHHKHLNAEDITLRHLCQY